MNYDKMIDALEIMEFQMRKNWYIHNTIYDCLIEQLKRCKRLDEGSLLDWFPIYFATFIFALIVFVPLVEQFTTGTSLLFVLIYAIVAYILAATYVFFYKNYIVKKYRNAEYYFQKRM